MPYEGMLARGWPASSGILTDAAAPSEHIMADDDDSYNRLEGKQRQLWLDLLYEPSAEPSLVASSRHLLYIGRKQEAQ